jgi:hypothetical protein
MADLKTLMHDLENFLGKLTPKAWFAGEEYNGQPAVIVTADEIVLAGNRSNVVRVSPDYGVQMAGPLSLSAMPAQIAIGGGYWRFNPLLLTCLPSTTPTPIPVLVKGTPPLLEGKDQGDDAESFLMSFSDAQ